MKKTSILFLLLGLALSSYSIQALSIPDTENFLQAEGQILKSVIRKIDENQFSLRVLYRYEIAGQSYEGQDVPSLSVNFPTHSEALKSQAEYFEGKNVTVYYLKDRPSEGTLEVKRLRPQWLGLFLGLSLIAAGWILVRRARAST